MTVPPSSSSKRKWRETSPVPAFTAVVLFLAISLVPVAYLFDVATDTLWRHPPVSFPRKLLSLSLSPPIRQVPYRVQVFSVDPLILYIHDFLSQDEIAHVLKQSQDRFEVSKVWPNGIGHVDKNVRVSETADLKRDDVVGNLEQRAAAIMGWRNNSTKMERMKVQRYDYNGYYSYHYDWDSLSTRGNRMVTFMVYLGDNCTGGGTNFPRVSRPGNQTWCEIMVCDGDEDEYPGVTFKPIAGSAVYWENFHPNGTPHRGVRHAGLPVRSGQKVGLNIWAWDSSWNE